MKAETSGEGLENLCIRVFQNYSMIAFGQTAIMTKLSLFTGSSKGILHTVFSFQLPSYEELDLSNKKDITNRTPLPCVDTSVLLSLMVRQVQAPQTSGVPKYELKVYYKDELKEVGIVA